MDLINITIILLLDIWFIFGLSFGFLSFVIKYNVLVINPIAKFCEHLSEIVIFF